MGKRLLIVGGTGFIGANIARASVVRGFTCTILSLNPPKNNAKIKGVSYLQADIANRSKLISLFSKRKFEYVVNLSGYIDHAPLYFGGRKVMDVHFIGLLNLLESLDRSLVKCFVQVGSSDEYGNMPAPQSEDMREAPISAYSLAKTASTHLLQMLFRTERFPAVIARLFLVYGEGQGSERFLPQVIQGCLKDEVFAVSAGAQIRDFCHVDDITEGIFAMLEAKNVKGEILNLASGHPIAIRTVIERVSGVIGSGNPQFGRLTYRPGENMELYANMDKAKKLMGWSPRIGFDEGLRRTVAFFRGA